MDSRLAYIKATSRAEGFRRDAELHTARGSRPRRSPRIPLVLMFLRADRG